MRHRVMALREADLGIRAEVQLAAEHERDDASEVRLERERSAARTSASRVRRTRPGCRAAARAPASSALVGAVLDLSVSAARLRGRRRDTRRPACDRPRPSVPVQPREVLVDRVEDAAVLARERGALRVRAAVAEQPLEHDARVVLRRQRRRRRAPRRACSSTRSCTRCRRCRRARSRSIDELERRQHASPCRCTRRRDLIGRHAVLDVRALGALGAHAREPRRRCFACDRRRAVARRWLRRASREAADHRQPIAIRRERRQDGRQLEARALPFGVQ